MHLRQDIIATGIARLYLVTSHPRGVVVAGHVTSPGDVANREVLLRLSLEDLARVLDEAVLVRDLSGDDELAAAMGVVTDFLAGRRGAPEEE